MRHGGGRNERERLRECVGWVSDTRQEFRVPGWGARERQGTTAPPSCGGPRRPLSLFLLPTPPHPRAWRRSHRAQQSCTSCARSSSLVTPRTPKPWRHRRGGVVPWSLAAGVVARVRRRWCRPAPPARFLEQLARTHRHPPVISPARGWGWGWVDCGWGYGTSREQHQRRVTSISKGMGPHGSEAARRGWPGVAVARQRQRESKDSPSPPRRPSPWCGDQANRQPARPRWIAGPPSAPLAGAVFRVFV